MQYCLKYLYIEYFLAVKGLGSLKFLVCHTMKQLDFGKHWDEVMWSVWLHCRNCASSLKAKWGTVVCAE